MRWNPFRRSPAHSRDVRLAERAAAAEAGLAAGRYELAHAEFAAVVDDYRAQLAEHPDDPELTELLAARLHGVAVSLEKLRRFDELTDVQDEAVRTSRRAVELRRGRHRGRRPRPGPGPADVRPGPGARRGRARRGGAGVDRRHGGAHGRAHRDPEQEHLDETYATELAQAQLLARRAGTSRPHGSRSSRAPATSTGCWTCSGRSGPRPVGPRDGPSSSVTGRPGVDGAVRGGRSMEDVRRSARIPRGEGCNELSMSTSANTPAGTIEQAVHAALATVDDPEIHRPITELGMVKSVAVVDGVADVGVFLTVAGCPMRETITTRVTDAVSRVPGITAVRVELDVMSRRAAHRACRSTCAAARPRPSSRSPSPAR